MVLRFNHTIMSDFSFFPGPATINEARRSAVDEPQYARERTEQEVPHQNLREKANDAYPGTKTESTLCFVIIFSCNI